MQELAGFIISKLFTLCILLPVRVSFALILLKYIFHAILSNDIQFMAFLSLAYSPSNQTACLGGTFMIKDVSQRDGLFVFVKVKPEGLAHEFTSQDCLTGSELVKCLVEVSLRTDFSFLEAIYY